VFIVSVMVTLNMVKCESVAGFAGHTCQVNIDDCVGQPCLNGATCEDAVNAYICHCHKGKISTHAKFSSLIRFYDNWNRQWLTFWATLHICVIVSVFQACDSRKARPKNKQWLKCHFRAQELWQKIGDPMLYGEPPSVGLDTTMDHSSCVQPISLAAVFRRRSRHGRYMMTTITTVRRNARSPTITALWGQVTLAINMWRPGTAFPCTLLALTTIYRVVQKVSH